MQDKFGVGVLGFEVLDDFRIILFAKPCIVINAQVAMQVMLDGSAIRNRRPGMCGLAGGVWCKD